MFRNLKYKHNGIPYTVDVGVNQDEKNINGAEDFYLKSNIEDFGDLSIFYGYEEFDCTGMILEKGKTYRKVFKNIKELESTDFRSLYEKGYTSIKVENLDKNIDFAKIPINIISKSNSYSNEIKVDEPANFDIKENNSIRFVFMNGFIIDLAIEKNYKMF